jgi:hypothetical protein
MLILRPAVVTATAVSSAASAKISQGSRAIDTPIF